MLNFFFHLFDQPDRKGNSNPETIATMKVARKAAAITITKVKDVWSRHLCSELIEGQSKVIIEDKHISDKILDIYSKWKVIERESRRPDRVNTKNYEEKVHDFVTDMEKPFKILIKKWESVLKKSAIRDSAEDIKHINNQMKETQIGSLAGVDMKQVKKDIRRTYELQRQEAAESRAKTEKEQLKRKVYVTEEDHLDDSNNIDDPDYDSGAPKPKRSKKINIMGPAAETGLARGVSQATQVLMAAAVAKAIGVDLDHTNISIGSTQYHNKKTLKQISKKVRSELDTSRPYSLHFDGAMLGEHGTKVKYNRIAVVLRSIDEKQEERILAIPKTSDGSGAGESKVVIAALEEAGIKEQIKSISFDTTSSNTSVTCDACKYVEDFIENPVLHCACRHHVAELQVRTQWKDVWGPTNDPGVWLFREFQKAWDHLKIDYSNLFVLDLKSLPDWMQTEANDVLTWASKEHSKNTWARADYKELLELVIIFLGGKIENFLFKLPGPDHHARWMSKQIYCLKISLMLNQYELEEDTKAKLIECAKFQAIIYIKYWFMCPFAAAAPLLDLEYYEKLLKWKTINPKQAFNLMTLARKHFWYLSPKLVPLSLFDSRVPAQVNIIWLQYS